MLLYALKSLFSLPFPGPGVTLNRISMKQLRFFFFFQFSRVPCNGNCVHLTMITMYPNAMGYENGMNEAIATDAINTRKSSTFFSVFQYQRKKNNKTRRHFYPFACERPLDNVYKMCCINFDIHRDTVTTHRLLHVAILFFFSSFHSCVLLSSSSVFFMAVPKAINYILPYKALGKNTFNSFGGSSLSFCCPFR